MTKSHLSPCDCRCQDVTGDKCVSRYIPKKPKKKKGHRRGTKSCLSMGSMGDLIKGSLKKFGTMDLTADSDASLNRSDHFLSVMVMPTSKLTGDSDASVSKSGLSENQKKEKKHTMLDDTECRNAQG
jgi:hypothetical protein